MGEAFADFIAAMFLMAVACSVLPFIVYIAWVTLVVWIFSNRDNRVDVHHYHNRRRR